MCGRFALDLPPHEVAKTFDAELAPGLPEGPRYNICPTQTIAAVAEVRGRRRMGPMRWGFIPRWYRSPEDGPLLFNARGESLVDKPAFAEAARRRRCLIPATGFYEWTDEGGARRPWFIRAAEGGLLALAGIWQAWEPPDGEARIVTCAIVTTEATGQLAALHHRVPVILKPEAWHDWLHAEALDFAAFIKPPAEGALVWYRVSEAVNSSRAEGAALIEPLNDDEPSEPAPGTEESGVV